MTAPLDTGPREGATSGKLADTVVSDWQAIEAALAPIIGTYGVAALYHRSLFLAAVGVPWLVADSGGDAPTVDLALLRTQLACREPGEAAVGAAALRRSFMELLNSLVGASLAERLLGPLWAQSTGDTAEQDTSSSS